VAQFFLTHSVFTIYDIRADYNEYKTTQHANNIIFYPWTILAVNESVAVTDGRCCQDVC